MTPLIPLANLRFLATAPVVTAPPMSRPGPNCRASRDAEMMSMRQRAASYRDIGKKVGLSHTRVKQLLIRLEAAEARRG